MEKLFCFSFSRRWARFPDLHAFPRVSRTAAQSRRNWMKISTILAVILWLRFSAVRRKIDFTLSARSDENVEHELILAAYFFHFYSSFFTPKIEFSLWQLRGFSLAGDAKKFLFIVEEIIQRVVREKMCFWCWINFSSNIDILFESRQLPYGIANVSPVYYHSFKIKYQMNFVRKITRIGEIWKQIFLGEGVKLVHITVWEKSFQMSSLTLYFDCF